MTSCELKQGSGKHFTTLNFSHIEYIHVWFSPTHYHVLVFLPLLCFYCLQECIQRTDVVSRSSLGTCVSGHDGDGLTVGLVDLSGLPNLNDSMKRRRRENHRDLEGNAISTRS